MHSIMNQTVAFKVDADCECDTFFPDMGLKSFAIWGSSEPRIDREAMPRPMRYTFLTYVRKDAETPPKFPVSMQAKHQEMQVD